MNASVHKQFSLQTEVLDTSKLNLNFIFEGSTIVLQEFWLKILLGWAVMGNGSLDINEHAIMLSRRSKITPNIQTLNIKAVSDKDNYDGISRKLTTETLKLKKMSIIMKCQVIFRKNKTKEQKRRKKWKKEGRKSSTQKSHSRKQKTQGLQT